MSGVADLNVKIGADISEVLSKVDRAKAKFNSLKEENGLLKAEIKDLNQSLKNNDSAIAKLNTTISKSIIVTKEDRAAVAALKKERNGLIESGKKIQASIKTTTSDLAVNNSQLKIHAAEVKKAEAAGSGFAKGATKVYSGLRKLAYIIPGLGIAGLVSLIAGPLIDAFGDWFDAVNKLSDAQQLLKDNIKNTNDINKAAGEDIAKQTSSLTTLYKIATDVSRSMYARVNATKALQKEFPDYFKNITQENILNGNAKSAYDALTDSLIANALAKAQLDKITDIGVKRSDLKSQVDDLIAERKRQLDAIKGAKVSNPSLGGSTGAPSTVISVNQQKEDINTFFDRQLIPLQNKINSFDNQIKKIRERLNPEALLSGEGGSSKSSNASGVLAVFDAQIKVLEDYKNNIATTAAEIASVNSQIKKLQEERAKYDPASAKRTKKEAETISSVLSKMYAQIDVLSKKEILQNVSLAPEKVKVIEKAIDDLLSKFKLLTDDPHIIELQAKIADINLTEQFKKDLKFDPNKPLPVPVDVEPEIQISGAFDETILRDELLKRLKEMGITKTVSVSLGIDPVTGVERTAKGGEDITGATNTTQLQATFDDAISKLKTFNDNANKIVNDMASEMAVSIGEALGNAFTGQGDAVKGLFDGIFSTLGTALQQLGKVAIETGLGIKAIKESFKSLNPFVAIAAGVGMIALGTLIKSSIQSAGNFAKGGLVKAFSNGGPVWGAGTATSDSIPARLSNGEYVIRAAKVSQFGVDFFNKINYGSANIKDVLKDKFGMMKFATGGLVSPNSVNFSRPVSVPNISIGGGQQIFIAESKLRGQDIVTSFKRASATISRNS